METEVQALNLTRSFIFQNFPVEVGTLSSLLRR